MYPDDIPRADDLMFPLPNTKFAEKLYMRRVRQLEDPDWSLSLAQREVREIVLHLLRRVHPMNAAEVARSELTDAERTEARQYLLEQDADPVTEIRRLERELYGEPAVNTDRVKTGALAGIVFAWVSAIALVLVGPLGTVPGIIAAAAGTLTISAAQSLYLRRSRAAKLNLEPTDFSHNGAAVFAYLDPTTPEGTIGARLDNVVNALIDNEAASISVVGQSEFELRNTRDQTLAQLANCQWRRFTAARIDSDIPERERHLFKISVQETTDQLKALDRDVDELEGLYQSHVEELEHRRQFVVEQEKRIQLEESRRERKTRAHELLKTLIEPPHAKQWTPPPANDFHNT